MFDRHSDDVGLDDMINGLVMLDVATDFLDCEPSRERDADTTAANLGVFAGGSVVKRCTLMMMDLSKQLHENSNDVVTILNLAIRRQTVSLRFMLV